jgi:hypothetical protein
MWESRSFPKPPKYQHSKIARENHAIISKAYSSYQRYRIRRRGPRDRRLTVPLELIIHSQAVESPGSVFHGCASEALVEGWPTSSARTENDWEPDLDFQQV